MAKAEMLREAQMPLMSVRAAPMPATFNRDNNTIDVVWTTGAQVRRYDWMDGPFIEELVVSPDAVRLDRLNGGAPVLDTHECEELEDIIGVVERAWLEGETGMATVRFSTREELLPYVQDIAAGIIRNVSVGYQVHQYEVTRPTDGSMPIYRAVDWEPMEISFVPIAADAASQVRSKDRLHPVSITTRGDDMSDPSENEIPAEETQASEAPVEVTETAAVDVAEEVRKAIALERVRAAEIRSTVRMAKLHEDIAEKLIDSGRSLDECRADVLRMWSEKVDSSATDSGRSEEEIATQTRSAELAQSIFRQVAGVK
ncbi:MAG: hypothetical protein RL661_917 [Pseudomonadota bacterium]|jgi:hypothetical protein